MSTDKPQISGFVKSLTGFEIIGIEEEFKREFNDLGAMRSLMGAVWALKNRETKTSWAAIKAMSIEEMEDVFATEDDTDPKEATASQA